MSPKKDDNPRHLYTGMCFFLNNFLTAVTLSALEKFGDLLPTKAWREQHAALCEHVAESAIALTLTIQGRRYSTSTLQPCWMLNLGRASVSSGVFDIFRLI